MTTIIVFDYYTYIAEMKTLSKGVMGFEKSYDCLLEWHGNTAEMANAVAEGVKEAQGDVKLLSVDQASVDDIASADTIALGCPAMGAEELEDMEMEPFVESIKEQVKGKTLALFGSYDWGDGEWMQAWQERMEGYGAKLLGDGYIVTLSPSADDITALKKIGSQLV